MRFDCAVTGPTSLVNCADYTPLELLLFCFGRWLWVVCCVVIIRDIRRHKFVGMPARPGSRSTSSCSARRLIQRPQRPEDSHTAGARFPLPAGGVILRGAMNRLWIPISLVVAVSAPVHAAERGAELPVIDMHLHTLPWVAGAADDLEAGWAAIRKQLDENHVELALVSGSQEVVERWREAAPSRIKAGVLFPCPDGALPNSGGRRCFPDGGVFPDLGWLRAEIAAGRVAFLGEITSQYAGMSPGDPRLEPYFALAEELDVPVAIHMGPGPPGAIYPNGVCGPKPCAPGYRAALSDPLLLEPVLVRHPGLRVWVMHAGWPMLEAMIHLLYSHPRVHVDLAVLGFDAVMPRASFERYVCRLVEQGFGKRLMWGSDFPQLGTAIAALEAVPCLTPEQRRDILHDNAARFLRLGGVQNHS